MRRITLFILCSMAYAQSGPQQKVLKPTDAAIAAYFKADSSLAASKANHEALMENVRKALSESIAAQVAATLRAQAAFSELQAQCGGNLDVDALQKSNDVKCKENAEK